MRQSLALDAMARPAERQLLEVIAAAEQRLSEVRSDRRWECPECGRRTSIKRLTVVTELWYRRPYSCSGGDYWAPNEDYPTYYVECPKCDVESRIAACAGNAPHGWVFVHAYKPWFGKQEDRRSE